MGKLLSHRLLERGGGSSSDDNPIGACCCCCGGILIIIIALALIVGNITTTPSCSIDLFNTHGINKTAANSTTNINYDLALDVGRGNKIIYYDALNLEFFYKPKANQSSSIGIASVTYPAFHQDYGTENHLAGFIDGSRVNWENVRAAIEENGYAVFRVNLNTSFRSSTLLWFKTKRHHLAVGADLHINEQGNLITRNKNHDVKLTSAAPNIPIQGYLHFLPFLSLLYMLSFLHSA